jgi:uncharacterized LabA/DUF88 family protein
MSQFTQHSPVGEDPLSLAVSDEDGAQLSLPFAGDSTLLKLTTDLSSSDRGRTILFVDGVNLFYAASQLKIEIDYAKLRHLFSQHSHLIQALFYTGVDPRNEKQKSFLLWMQRHGYRVVTKELPITSEGFHRVSMNVEIAVDMLTLSEHCHTEVVMSSDGDLSYAIQAVHHRGVQVEVVALRTMASDRLIQAANHYVDLADLRDKIQKPSKHRPG